MHNFDKLAKRCETVRRVTRIDPNYTMLFGCEELRRRGLRRYHCAVPETPEQLLVNGMELATRGQARVAFLCDTPAQAHSAARKATKMLPNHSRVSLERTLAGAWGGLQ